MGPSLASVRADEIQVGMVIVAGTQRGEPFEPARSWSDVTATEEVVSMEILPPDGGPSLVKVVTVRTVDADPAHATVRFFPADQVVQEVP